MGEKQLCFLCAMQPPLLIKTLVGQLFVAEILTLKMIFLQRLPIMWTVLAFSLVSLDQTAGHQIKATIQFQSHFWPDLFLVGGETAEKFPSN